MTGWQVTPCRSVLVCGRGVPESHCPVCCHIVCIIPAFSTKLAAMSGPSFWAVRIHLTNWVLHRNVQYTQGTRTHNSGHHALYRARAWTTNTRNIHKCNGYLSFSRAPMFVCYNLVKILTPCPLTRSLNWINPKMPGLCFMFPPSPQVDSGHSRIRHGGYTALYKVLFSSNLPFSSHKTWDVSLCWDPIGIIMLHKY